MFDRSQILVLGREEGSERPWRWNPAPVFGNGPMEPPTVEGTKQVLPGVVILLTDGFVDILKEGLTQTQKDELNGWIYKVSNESPTPDGFVDAATWHIPIWAGQTRAWAFRVPAAVWNDPTTTPPAKVRNFMRHLWREANG